MDTKAQIFGNHGTKQIRVYGAAKGGQPNQPLERLSSLPVSSLRRSADAMTDLQSFSMMEERYGIREEGLF